MWPVFRKSRLLRSPPFTQRAEKAASHMGGGFLLRLGFPGYYFVQRSKKK